MKKTKRWKNIRIQKRRTKKHLKRLKKVRYYKDIFTTETKNDVFKRHQDTVRINKFDFQLNKFLNKFGNPPVKQLSTDIEIPNIFSLEKEYNETILTLSLIRKSLLNFLGHKIIIDFTNCKEAEFSALFLLKIMLDEYLKELNRLDSNLLYYNAKPDITIQHSKDEKVNLALLANAIIKNVQAPKTNFLPISIHNMIIGKKNQKHYHENKKGSAATSIRKYINSGIKRHGFELDHSDESFFDGMISEILNNAEDHSLFDTWYAFANLFETKKDETDCEIVSEINFAFMNFGYSIHEGFEETKEKNFLTYREMESMYQMVSNAKSGNKFSKENLFTLYALQEGNSRLKYDEESRGTGTMKFIKSFLNLGDYEDQARGYIPRLIIFSGSTMLKCDNTYKPFEIDGVNYLSLNIENDMTIPPSSTHLKTLKNRFPGTLITGKIYLNKNHLGNKLKNGN